MPKIDLKLVAVASIILGLFTGFYIDNTILSKPQINTLTDTVAQQEATITGLESQMASLQSEYDALVDEYSGLTENNITFADYLALQSDVSTLETQVNSLETEVNQLTLTITGHEETMDELEDELNDLQSDYDNLMVRYTDIYNPVYVAYTADNLQINLTTTSDTYPDNTAIQGTVKLQYTNGTSFKGTFKLTLYKVYQNSGTSSQAYSISKKTSYTWNSPFVLGSGSYKLSISEIKDLNGNTAVSNTILRNQVIYIFVG